VYALESRPRARRTGDVEVRWRLRDQCTKLDAARAHELGVKPCEFLQGSDGKDLPRKQRADFCLEPAGDTPYRKSLADSLSFGCIPILFHPMTDNANEWLWNGWKEASRILVPRDAFLRGNITLEGLLQTIPAPLVALMKRTVMKYARRFQISVEDDLEGDEVHMMLLGAAEYASKRHRHRRRPRHDDQGTGQSPAAAAQ
jgi:hypothetical protein